MNGQTGPIHNFYCTTRHFLLLSILMVIVSACEKELQLPALSENAVILAFGDSLTYGTGASNQSDYPTILAELSTMEVINAGVPGEITVNGLRRLPGLLDEYQPDLLILIHGGNDFLRKKPESDTVSNLSSMIDLAHDREISVMLLGVPKPGLLLSSADFYQTLADQKGVPVDTEILPDILGDQDLKSDTVHPNDKGYRIMAEAVYGMLQKHGALLRLKSDDFF